MDYKKELIRLQEQEANIGSDFWKPKPGQYKVKGLGEIEDAPPYEEDGKEPQLRKMIHIKVNDKEFSWSMPLGKTPASTYGQLVHLASIKGKLKDEEFTVVVVGEGQNIRFTIVI